MTLSPDLHVTLIEACLLAIVFLLLVCTALQLRAVGRVGRGAETQAAVRDVAEGLRSQMATMDRDLRVEIAGTMKDGLVTAFDRVQSGAEAQSRELARFGAALKEESAATLAAFGTEQTARLGALDTTVREGGMGVQAVLGAFKLTVAERLDAVAKSSTDQLDRAAATFNEIKAAVVASEANTAAALAAQHVAVIDRLTLGQGEASARLTTDLGGLVQQTKDGFEGFATTLRGEQERLRTLVGAKLDEMRAGNEAKLEDMRKAVDEKLQTALEKQIGESFQRVAEQFAAVQQAIGQVQSVAGQVGDLRRLFSNVKSRGGWGEAQAEAMLQDMLPAGAYQKNMRIREGSGEHVEFAIRIPSQRGGEDTWLAVDSKFPTEDYERLLSANEAGSREDEATHRTALERRIRAEAQRIASKYILAPKTLDFAILYLPSDSLYAEVARSHGLLETIRRDHKVMVMGPSLLPAFLHTVKIGYMTVALERNATQIGETLAAVKTEWGKLLPWLDTIAKRTDTLKKGIESVQQRARAVGRSLKSVDVIDHAAAEAVLGLDAAEYVQDSIDEADEAEPTLELRLT